MSWSAEQIDQLFDNFCKSATRNGYGTYIIDDETERYRLLACGVELYRLDRDALCAAIVGTTKAMLRPGYNNIITNDTQYVWSWCAQLLIGQGSEIYANEERELNNLFVTAFRTVLSKSEAPITEEHDFARRRLVRSQLPYNQSELLSRTGEILLYLAFPLLEGNLKKICSDYVAFDGSVKQDFEVPSGSKPKKYSASSKGKRPQIVSSLRDLLFLYSDKVADERQKSALQKFIAHIACVESPLVF